MRWFFFATMAVVGLVVLPGCSSSGQPAADSDEVTEKTMESGLKALQPGVEQDVVTEAMEQFRQTGQIDPELRKKLEQQGQQMYGGQYPGARGRPPSQ